MKSQRSRRQHKRASTRRGGKKLEQRVSDRTKGLVRANEALKLEIAERKRAEALLDCQKRVLELVASGAPLKRSMEALTRVIEAQAPGMFCSVLLLDDDQVHLRNCAAPSLPAAFRKAIDGLKLGPRAGSSGTSASSKMPVHVEDIATDWRWAHYRAAALPHGLRSCWSTPIFDSKRRVLGNFAMFCHRPGRPSPEHIRLIEIATHVASIAICRDRDEAALRDHEAKLKEAQRLANLGYWERDLQTDRIIWSEGIHRIFGRPDRGAILTQARLQKMIHPDDRPIQSAAFKAALHGGPLYDVEYRIIRPGGEVRFLHVRDVSGKI
jgi:PAS domain-containing protein